MSRIVIGAAFAAMAGLSAAQGNFTIVRPYDGARVRENVRILVPKNSVPGNGYLGVFVDGKLFDAAQPKLDATKNYYEYVLDTKGRGITDGRKKIEVRLYVEYNGQPRIVDTSSIDVTVANSTGIRVPDDGILLRYAWRPGTEHEYRLEQKVILSTTDNNSAGARAASIEQEGEGIRLLYAVDNAYGNGDGLLRLQVIPNRGTLNKEYAYLTTAGATEPQRFYPESMAPIYMRVSSTGREVFGAVPFFPGSEDGKIRGQGSTAQTSLFAAFPLPVLPAKAVRKGSTWQVPFQNGAIDLANLYTQNSIVTKFPARGEFLGTEWEMGHPCAKIRNSIAIGTAPLQAKTSTSNTGGTISDQKIGLEETIYFALDTRQIIKIIREQTIESKVSNAGAQGGGSPAGEGAGAGPRGGPGRKSGGGVRGGDFRTAPGNFAAGQKPPGGAPSGVASSGSQRGPGGMGPGGPGGPGGYGNSAPQNTYVRQKLQQVFTLVR